MADETAADAKYKGERLLFNEVEVEEVDSHLVHVGGGEEVRLKYFFIIGFVQFYLRDFDIMQNIEVGYVLNIVGECRGLVSGLWWYSDGEPLLLVNDCWVESVIGDITTGGEIDIY